ncbi:MAG TPA: phosphoserine phosphatase SerB [Afifellaceae bacterium]|nr:phosphoserine phosphatase SerB [Afifellaceae bacterium]
MNLVLTLIAAKAKTPLTADIVSAVNGALAAGGVTPGPADWLAEDEACDIYFDGEKAAESDLAHGVIAGRAIDFGIVPAARRRKQLLIADMDSTMIGQECIDELAAEIGAGETVAAITEQAMRGDIAFRPALRQRAALLEGLPVTAVDKVLAERITLTQGGATLVATMRANGAYASLVSGGFTAFAEPIAGRLGFDEFRANRLEHENGLFTGAVAEPALGRDAKRARLTDLIAERGLAGAGTLAVGDGANDLAMIRLAGLGVAFHAKPAVEVEADAAIRHGDLTALLYLRGYRREEFVA